MQTILDFHIHPQEKGGFSLEIFKRGNTQPLTRKSFDYDLSYMTQFEMNRLEDIRDKPAERFNLLKDFGTNLYNKVFTTEVKQIWQDYKEKSDFLVLCLRMSPEASSLEVLPWETIYDGDEFLAAGAKTGVSRLPLDVPIQDDLSPVPSPLKMLALISSPLDLAENERLMIEREQEILLQAVNTPAGRGKLHLEFEDEAKIPIIEERLESDWQIFHYSGHGIPPERGGGLLLEDSQGKKLRVPIKELIQALQKVENNLRLIVISGCQTARTLYTGSFSDLARSLVKRKIPAVIAMQFSISDNAGTLFAENLYQHLADGRTLEMVVSSSRRALLHNKDLYAKADVFAPVIFVANSTPVQTTTATPTQTIPQPGIDYGFHLPLPQLDFGFYGRRREYRIIRDGLLYKNLRAVILHGIGGIGKTALISHVATRLRQHFKGVYAFDCQKGTLAPETILLELHRYLERQGIQSLQQLLHQSIPPDQLAGLIGQVLSQIPLLIIFDNFETHLSHNKDVGHVIADEDLHTFITTLVKTTSRESRFLFTSRYLFDIDAKRIGNIKVVPLNDLSRSEAIGLMQKLPNISGSSFADKLQVYKTFGGHPYALVTLDRHCGHKSVQESLKDAANVHAELREFIAIEMNYANISVRSRELLNRFSAFREPMSTEAVHWVMGKKVELSKDILKHIDRNNLPDKLKSKNDNELLSDMQKYFPEKREAIDIDKHIDELIGWGLLIPVEQEGQVRELVVHSLVREFCCGKQNGKDWRKRLYDAAAYYTNVSRIKKQDEKSMNEVFNEMEAFELLFIGEYFEDAAVLLIGVTPLLYRWGFGRYGEALYYRIIPKVKKEAQSILIHNLGIIFQGRGNYKEAIELYEKSLKIKEEIGNKAGVATSLHQIGMIQYLQGNYKEAIELYEKSLKIKEEIGHKTGVAGSLHQIGMIHQDQGNYKEALEQYEKSLKINEEIGNKAGVASSLHQIGMIHQDQGNYKDALELCEKSLKLKEEIGDKSGVASSLHGIGTIHQDQGNYKDAIELYEKSLKISKELGDKAGVASSLHQIGMIHQNQGNYKDAIELYEKSLKISKELGDKAGVASSLHQIGMIHQDQGNYKDAIELYEKSLKISKELGDKSGVAGSQHQIGTLFIQIKKYSEAFVNLLLALNIFSELNSPNTKTAINNLKGLREKWGAENFDKAWTEKTGKDVPDWLKGED